MDQYFFKTPFALTGDTAPIPRPTQPGGEVSYNQGYGPDYSLPNLSPSAKKVPRDQTNQLYFALTQAVQQYQTFGTPEWITAADNDAVSYSYSKDARVRYWNGSIWKVYLSLVDSNTFTPGTDPTKWLEQTASGGGGSGSVLHIQYQQPSGTDGGTFTAGAWQTRVLNTVLTNGITGASLSSNQITLPVGSYSITARGCAVDVDANKVKIRNITAASDLLVGMNSNIDSGSEIQQGHAVVTGFFTVAVITVIELQHRCQSTQATDGFGKQCNFGVVEVYADVMIEKIS